MQAGCLVDVSNDELRTRFDNSLNRIEDQRIWKLPYMITQRLLLFHRWRHRLFFLWLLFGRNLSDLSRVGHWTRPRRCQQQIISPLGRQLERLRHIDSWVIARAIITRALNSDLLSFILNEEFLICTTRFIIFLRLIFDLFLWRFLLLCFFDICFDFIRLRFWLSFWLINRLNFLLFLFGAKTLSNWLGCSTDFGLYLWLVIRLLQISR